MQIKRSFKSIIDLVSKCSYDDWEIKIGYENDHKIGDPEGPFIQIQFDAPCTVTGKMERQFCRKWKLSYFMTDSEIVGTVYAAVERAAMHETRERFKFDGQPIFRPHFDIYALHEISEDNRISKRE